MPRPAALRLVLAALALASFGAAAPAVAAPYRLDRLHDREDAIQDAVDRRRLPARAGRELTRIRALETRMRARHNSNLTPFEFGILESRLDAVDGGRRALRPRPRPATPTASAVRR